MFILTGLEVRSLEHESVFHRPGFFEKGIPYGIEILSSQSPKMKYING